LSDDHDGALAARAPRTRSPFRAACAVLALCVAYQVVPSVVWGSAADATESGSLAARGQAILAPFKSALQSALREGLAEEGPVHAIGVRVGRTSHRLRNPRNAPEPWMEPLLAHYLEDPEARAPRTVSLEGGRAGYVEPIFVQAPCLACHGESLAPGVAERLAELYPEDRATGFAIGDFRGLFWAQLPAEP
jgi:hypothetical protein